MHVGAPCNLIALMNLSSPLPCSVRLEHPYPIASRYLDGLREKLTT